MSVFVPPPVTRKTDHTTGTWPLGTLIYDTTAHTLWVGDGSTSGGQVVSVAGAGTVTSVGLSLPAEFTVTVSPITTSGNLTATWATETAHYVFAAPTGGGTPSFRALVPSDLPAMVASGSTHAPGIVPDPPASSGTTKYLREDAQWAVPPTGGGGSMGIGNAVTGGNANRVLFEDGSVNLADDSLFGYDSTNHRLGIGTPTPGAPLELRCTSGGPFPAEALRLNNNTNSAGAGGSIDFWWGGDTGQLGGRIAGWPYTASTAEIVFYVGPGTVNGLKEQMRIGDGYVSIQGTITFNKTLTVYDGSTTDNHLVLGFNPGNDYTFRRDYYTGNMEITGTAAGTSGFHYTWNGYPFKFTNKNAAVNLFELYGISSTSTERQTGVIDSGFTVATDASRTGYVSISTSGFGGTYEGFRATNDGSKALIGAFGATPVAQQTGDVLTGLANLGFFTSPTINGIPIVTTVAALKALSGPTGTVEVQGYYAAGDGGGGLFRWNTSDTTTADNGGTILVSGTSSAGRWYRICEGPTNAKWFGVNPSQTDNTQALQNAVNWVSITPSGGVPGGDLYIPAGFYKFAFTAGSSGLSTITISADNVTIRGAGRSTILTTRSPSVQVAYFFTWTETGARGVGGGLRDLCIAGNSQTQWGVFLDAWRFWEMKHVNFMDMFSGLLDACNNQSDWGENIIVHHCDYIPSSGTNSCLTQYAVQFRAGTVGTWSECTVRDCLFVGVWDTGVVLDGCQRFTVNQIGVANSISSSNTIAGATKAGVLHAVVITNSVQNSSTTDTGYHTVSSIYMESHSGTETYANNSAILLETPTTQAATSFNRYNRISDIAIDTSTSGPKSFIFIKNTHTTAGLTSGNTFIGNRRSYNSAGLIQIGGNVVDTYLYLTPSGGQLWKLTDSGNRTWVNGVHNYAYAGGAGYPDITKTDVGFITRDTVSGRVCWQDQKNVPVLIGPRPGKDVVSPYGAQRITSLATPGAPIVTPGAIGSTTYVYYVVAVDKDGNKTPPGTGTTITNGAASLAGSNQNTITWMPVDGAVTYDLLKGDTAHSITTGLVTCFFQDSGASTSAYSASGTSPPGTLTIDGGLTLGDAANVVLGTTTGTKIGTATNQMLGFYNATPIVQPTVTGSRGGNAALASLLTTLATLGLIVDSSS